MNIKSFKNHSYVQLFEKDNTERDIGYSHLTDVIITGRNNYYPNTLLYSANEMLLISPYDEKIMSLNKESFYDNNIYDLLPETSSIINKNEFKENNMVTETKNNNIRNNYTRNNNRKNNNNTTKNNNTRNTSKKNNGIFSFV